MSIRPWFLIDERVHGNVEGCDEQQSPPLVIRGRILVHNCRNSKPYLKGRVGKNLLLQNAATVTCEWKQRFVSELSRAFGL